MVHALYTNSTWWLSGGSVRWIALQAAELAAASLQGKGEGPRLGARFGGCESQSDADPDGVSVRTRFLDLCFLLFL